MKIVILDYGSQYTRLIAQKVRQLKVYAEIIDHKTKWSDFKTFDSNN